MKRSVVSLSSLFWSGALPSGSKRPYNEGGVA